MHLFLALNFDSLKGGMECSHPLCALIFVHPITAVLDVVEIGDCFLIAGQTANGAIAPDDWIGISTGDGDG